MFSILRKKSFESLIFSYLDPISKSITDPLSHRLLRCCTCWPSVKSHDKGYVYSRWEHKLAVPENRDTLRCLDFFCRGYRVNNSVVPDFCNCSHHLLRYHLPPLPPRVPNPPSPRDGHLDSNVFQSCDYRQGVDYYTGVLRGIPLSGSNHCYDGQKSRDGSLLLESPVLAVIPL